MSEVPLLASSMEVRLFPSHVANKFPIEDKFLSIL
jgi:hypothetical protein